MLGISCLPTISSYLWQMNAEDKIRDSFNEHVMANPIIGGWKKMKKEGHPAYYQTKVTCGCGNTFVTGGTRPELVVDICSACHPFYTGKLKYVDTAGRIEKFKSKFASGNYASLQAKKKKGKS